MFLFEATFHLEEMLTLSSIHHLFLAQAEINQLAHLVSQFREVRRVHLLKYCRGQYGGHQGQASEALGPAHPSHGLVKVCTHLALLLR